jgi:hypothetical protein
MWRIVVAALVIYIIPYAALAQSPAPIGFWSTGNGGESLLVTRSGFCEFRGSTTHILGSCRWRSSAGGGILTIMNTNQFRPAPIYENIVWIDRTRITVWGDVFFRRQ